MRCPTVEGFVLGSVDSAGSVRLTPSVCENSKLVKLNFNLNDNQRYCAMMTTTATPSVVIKRGETPTPTKR